MEYLDESARRDWAFLDKRTKRLLLKRIKLRLQKQAKEQNIDLSSILSSFEQDNQDNQQEPENDKNEDEEEEEEEAKGGDRKQKRKKQSSVSIVYPPIHAIKNGNQHRPVMSREILVKQDKTTPFRPLMDPAWFDALFEVKRKFMPGVSDD